MRKYLVLSLVFILAACSASEVPVSDIKEGADSNEKIVVSVTIPPLVSIVEQIGGDKVEVHGILPPGISPHTYEVSPKDIQKLSESSLVYTIGLGVDNWMEPLLDSLDESVEIVDLSEKVELLEFAEHDDDNESHDEHENEVDAHEHDEHEDHEDHEEDHDEHEDDHDDHGHDHGDSPYDPHYWLSPENAKKIAEKVAVDLSTLDGVNNDYYWSNQGEFSTELDQLDAEIKAIFTNLEIQPKLLVFHDAWNYFAKHYNLEIVGAFALSPGKTPSPQYLQEIYEVLEANNLQVIFAEPQLASTVLSSVVEDFNLEVFTLDPLGGIDGRETYQDLLLYNAKTIQAAFE